jgi:uncharacterized membrane protein
MVIKGLFEGQAFIKDSLEEQFKAYRNMAIKLALLLWIASFSFCFVSELMNVRQVNFDLTEIILHSLKASILFGVIGYCIGSVCGTYMQHNRLRMIEQEKKRRKEYIKSQLASREERLGII